MEKLQGVFVVMTTPLLEDQKINFDGVAKNIEHLISQNVHGLMVCGALGEYLTLDLAERKELAAFVLKTVAGRVPVIVGTISARADITIDLSNHAYEHGAAGVMVLPPPGSGIEQEEIYQYFKTVSDNVKVAIMAYNNPGSSGLDIDFDTLSRIAKLENVKYIKESSGDIKRVTRIAYELADDIAVFCGWEDMCLESFNAGASGWVCMGGNFAPNMTRDVFDLVKKGEGAAAADLYKKYVPVARYLENAGKVVQTTKFFQEEMGLVGGIARNPRLPLNEDEKAAIRALIKERDLH
ncbi:dihydrodipicolinate synthase family protein [Rhodobacteraceae bacterium RKSG542]|uniref:dihydrodipicolinate synthase family protein n=1 Tax=Pseudovibrio flavus TaxID=2529854 RepID=UPI0012BCB6BD|nr:dihydrodipicolinate synthase family protein [Pseudovibrio flavus]MTI15958.1 dihydrodipicolinate synthase family protein [Pseudovibrio flavus]